MSFSLAAVVPRRRLPRWLGHRGVDTPDTERHRLGRGLPEYLIPFAPHAFAPQRQGGPRPPPCATVFRADSTDFTLPARSAPSAPLQPPRLARPPASRGIPRATAGGPTRPLRPMNPDNARPYVLPRCWHVVSRGFLARYRLPPRLPWGYSSRATGVYGPRAFLPHAALLRRGSPVAQDPSMLNPAGLWTMSQSQCGRPASQPGYPSPPRWAVVPPTS